MTLPPIERLEARLEQDADKIAEKVFRRRYLSSAARDDLVQLLMAIIMREKKGGRT